MKPIWVVMLEPGTGWESMRASPQWHYAHPAPPKFPRFSPIAMTAAWLLCHRWVYPDFLVVWISIWSSLHPSTLLLSLQCLKACPALSCLRPHVAEATRTCGCACHGTSIHPHQQRRFQSFSPSSAALVGYPSLCAQPWLCAYANCGPCIASTVLFWWTHAELGCRLLTPPSLNTSRSICNAYRTAVNFRADRHLASPLEAVSRQQSVLQQIKNGVKSERAKHRDRV